MKRRNQIWTCYLKMDIGRQVLWVSLALAAASLVVGVALLLQVQPLSAAQRRPQPETLPSGNVPNPNDHFLTFNGIDNPVSACNYYKAIRALDPLEVDCNAVITDKFGFFHSGDGKILGITFDEWKHTNGFDDPRTEEVSALYFNAVDLALARSMHGKTSLVNGVETVAYYVCNYKTLEEARVDADNSDALACVAFDFSERQGQDFTKLYVFKKDPSGIFSLAGSADLDGKEKFVPGLCKACHGGDNEPRQQFAGKPDIGAHFLPFDLDNFEYLEDSAFSRIAQESKFKRLNQMIPDPTPVVRELIEGWYDKGRLAEQNSQFIPPGWMGNEQLYRRVVKPSCRTCHVAMRHVAPDLYDFKTLEDFTALAVEGKIHARVCVNAEVNSPPAVARLSRSMPNAKVTFDQFWLSRVQRTVLVRFLRDAQRDPSITCPPP